MRLLDECRVGHWQAACLLVGIKTELLLHESIAALCPNSIVLGVKTESDDVFLALLRLCCVRNVHEARLARLA